MPKQDCILCQIIDGKVPSKKLYEDEEVVAVLDVNGANIGHSFVMPKEHHTILEQVPDDLVGKLFQVANKISSAIFETLQVQGTNIFVTNGLAAGQVTPHFMVNVIPRNENDGINLVWEPKKLSEEDMSTLELQIKTSTENVGFEKGEKPKQNLEKKQPETISGEDNYKLKQLDKVP